MTGTYESTNDGSTNYVAITRSWRRTIDVARAAGAAAERAVDVATGELRDAETTRDDVAAARDAVNAVANAVQRRAIDRVAGIVSAALAAVFDEPYEFRIEFETKRGRTEACCVFVRDGVEIDPMTAAGGGVVDVAAFVLRVARVALGRSRRRLLVLDEPFRFVSAAYRPNVRALVESLAESYGFQFVVVTHIDEFRIGDVVEIG